ncbi:CBS domain-containing protein [Streptomyces antibioticus]|uniref:CBS domain-containing protein n=1 Tax=Streptomyces antibioticus TaxID=1890 RepID=UPI0033E81D51
MEMEKEMSGRTVGEIMSKGVVCVQRRTLFKEIVHVLREYDITAVVVTDGLDRPVGVVSEADLMHKLASPGRESSPSGIPIEGDEKSRGATAEELMTSPVLCAGPGWPVSWAAHVMETYHVKRLLVTGAQGEVVGLVSRSDILQVFLRRDAEIKNEIVEEVLVKGLGEQPSTVSVEVLNGEVVLSGEVSSTVSISIIEHICRGIDGVVSVRSRLRCLDSAV